MTAHSGGANVTSDGAKKAKTGKAAAADGEGATAAGRTALEAAVGRLSFAAYGALALSIVGVALVLTHPAWAPRVFGNAAQARFLALGVAQLRPVLETDSPFAVELATLRTVAVGDREVTRVLEGISSLSGVGVPTLTQLQDRFGRVATEIMLSDIIDSSRSPVDRAMLSLASSLELHALFHRMKDKHLPSEEALFNAQFALAAGDLQHAVDALDALSGRSAAIAEPWVKDARARLAAGQVLQYLETVAARRMAAGPLPAALRY
jgi:hypothetical protein